MEPVQEKPREEKWYYNPIVVIIALFLVLGPFGLPLLFKSPKFNRPFKIILAILVIVYSLFLLFVTFSIFQKICGELAGLK